MARILRHPLTIIFQSGHPLWASMNTSQCEYSHKPPLNSALESTLISESHARHWWSSQWREMNKRNSMKKGNNDIETLFNSTVAWWTMMMMMMMMVLVVLLNSVQSSFIKNRSSDSIKKLKLNTKSNYYFLK